MEETERLIDAVNNGCIEEVRGFLDRGADVETTDTDGDSLLLLAAGEGDLEMVKLLLERGADPFHVGGDGFIVWHWVAYGCSLEIAHILLPLNKHIDMEDYDGMTPLAHALADDCMEIAEFLLAHGADPNSADDHGWSLLHDMASDGNEQGARLLLKYGARIDLEDKRGALPYRYLPHDKMDELLLELYPDDGVEDSPLVDAVNNRRIEEVKGLLDGGESVDTTDADGDSLLVLAAFHGDVEMVKLLLERGANPLQVDGKALAIWHGVAFGCSLEIAWLLLPLNKDIDMKDPDGATPLEYALLENCMKIAEFLLLNGADPNACDEDGWTLLHGAARRGDEEGVRLLLRYGARIDLANKRGVLPYQRVPGDKPELLSVLAPENRQVALS